MALANRRFLRDDGRLLLSVKARSEDVTGDPEAVFDEAVETLSEEYEIRERRRLEPFHDDHLAVVAAPE